MNGEVRTQYEAWFNQVISQLPGVQHYSWFNIKRKIRTYRDYWSKHWQSLYDITQEDTAENNMFFDKAWVDVSEDELDAQAEKLASELGGWIFHKKVDFDQEVPHLIIDRGHSPLTESWLERNT